MSFADLKTYPSFVALVKEVEEAKAEAQVITNSSGDFNVILRAQGNIETLDWFLDKLDDDHEPDYSE